MNTTLDSTLVSKYPKMFANRFADMTTTAMCWGFEHGDGWYSIIDNLCYNIQSHIDWREKQAQSAINYNNMRTALLAGDSTQFNQSISFSTDDIFKERRRNEIIEGDFRKVPDTCSQVTVEQVKEKFGTLRFYYSGGDEYINGLVSMAESMSGVMCEECGTIGRTRRGGWIRTLCDKHAEEHGYYTTAEEENI